MNMSFLVKLDQISLCKPKTTNSYKKSFFAVLGHRKKGHFMFKNRDFLHKINKAVIKRNKGIQSIFCRQKNCTQLNFFVVNVASFMGNVFGDTKVTTTFLDSIIHLLETGHDSCRFKQISLRPWSKLDAVGWSLLMLIDDHVVLTA